ncbi:1649_t:CDS:10, partial [Racocetra fulgida]
EDCCEISPPRANNSPNVVGVSVIRPLNIDKIRVIRSQVGDIGSSKSSEKKFEKADWKEKFSKKQVGISDMTMLSKVNNDAINENLKKRFENHEIYDLGIYTDQILKSYTGKNLLEYIATVSGGASSQIKEIKDMVLATNPLLESFGCAKTLRNNNSSRHGKYLEIQFNSQGEPVGAVITNYLLEKRNFHIFYQFTKAASPEYQDQFGIQGPESYLYTCKSGCLDVDGIDDTKDYSETLEAMSIIGLTQSEQDDIFRMLAIILWLGNVQFEENKDGNAAISDEDVTNFIAYIMEIDGDVLIKASAVRDALAKAIYNNLFEWIVDRINSALRSRTTASHVIGVLDIYGFEIFEENSFEQLCINYVNEKLQQIFIELTLKTEQEEYVKEKIKWTPIEFFDNKIVCDLIEGKRPPGIFAALNDACATAHADSEAADNSFVQRLGFLSSNPHFESRGSKFLVKHYAGDVLYTISGMTDKNKDQLVKDLLELIESSGNKFVRQLFPNKVDRDSKKRPPTIGDKIKSSANALVTNLMQARPSYIRTIKPNHNKSPSEYDQKMVLHQIKYLGLNENIRVRRAGFAYRQTFEKFLERFYLLSKKTSYAGEYTWRGDSKTGAERVLKDCGIATEEWQMGVTKVFIRHPETLRDYGHQILDERKERRRFSLLSMRKFMGDYLFVNIPGGSGEALRNACDIGALYIVISTLEKKLLTMNVERKIPLVMIKGASLSHLRDDWVILHIDNPTKELGDLIFSCLFKTEFVTHLSELKGNRFDVNISESIEYTKKINKTATMKFIKDENVKDDVYKSHTVTVCSGEPSNSLSDPPCPRKESSSTASRKPQKTSKATKPKVTKTPASINAQKTKTVTANKPSAPVSTKNSTAIYDFATEDSGELPFNKGDVLEIIEKDDNGWWLAKMNDDQGWVPSNYLEEIKVAPVPTRRNKPPPPAIPTKATS